MENNIIFGSSSNQKEMKTFDQLLDEVWTQHGVSDKSAALTLAIKVAITQRIGVVDLVDQVATFTENYVLEGGTELTVTDEYTEAIGEMLVEAFGITPQVGEVLDREFDFEEWVENAEGPPAMGSMELLQAYSQAIFSEDNLKLLQ